jgi:CRP-like cAMP-binding protein
MGNCQRCIVKELSKLSALTSSQLKQVSACKTASSFKKGDVILKEGSMLNGVYCIKEGKCKLTKLGPDGKEQIIKFITSGDMLGYRAVLAEEPVSLSVVALEDMAACFIPKQDILTVFHQNKNFSKNLFSNVCNELNDANTIITNMAQKTVRERLAETLLFLEDTFGHDEDGFIDVVLSREELSSVVGTATESAIRLLSEMKKNRIISLEGKRIKILDGAVIKRIGFGF